jgi:hypothetical protein
MPDDIFKENDKLRLINKIREDELKAISNGEYT